MFGADLSLQFRLFGIPIHVSLFFLLLVVLLGQGAAKGKPLLLVAWVGIAAASVLLHELGHALTARAFGKRPYILLYGMGGVTTWRERQEMTAGRRFIVSLAGPAVGVALGIVALGFYVALPDKKASAGVITSMIVFANLGWGVLNLIPMLPLDGGQVVAAVFDLMSPGSGARAARYVSIVTAVVIAPLAVLGGLFLLALYCAFSVWMNVQALRTPPSPPAGTVIDVPAQVLPGDEPPPSGRA
jgi:Zn-dependent protease